ncbi:MULTISPECIES: calcium-binding protein [unclassified Microcoleus]|uniref:calcium-binding protein n=1 Tax=unclassified Microcoleus TaxID=2642155 RepID=UPI002FD007DD
MTTLSDDPNQLDLNLPGLGPDTIFAGAGADFVRTSTLGGSLIFGQGDNDTLVSVGPNDTIYGGEDEDSIRSQRTPALLFGDGGADTIVAEARATLYGGAGEDFLQGTVEANLIFGNEDADTILGGAQRRDSLYGGKGNDAIGFFIAGGGNNLSLPGDLAVGFAGNEGSNYLRGDLGDDLVVGINQRDSLFGGKGNDTLRGVASSSYLSGDLDNDTLVIENGTQAISFFGTTVTVAIGVEKTTLLGGGGDDILFGGYGDPNSGRNFLDGGDGNDTITVFATQDTALGGAGDDIIKSSTATIPGVLSSGGRNLLDGGDGNDTIMAAFSTDTMIGGGGNDTLSGLFAQAFGGEGDDTIDASSAGNAGRISLDGGLGNDFLIGNSTSGVTNLMNGGEGNDMIMFGTTGDKLIGSFGGNDTISYAVGVTFTGITTTNVITDNLGSNFITGGNGNDSITTGAGDDILFGGPTSLVTLRVDGNDTLNSGDGNDTLLGGFGDDYLIGGNGNDSLGGGPGADTLIGGFGSDSFYYDNFGEGVTIDTNNVAVSTNPDQIGDFQPGVDKLVFNYDSFLLPPFDNSLPNRASAKAFLQLETGTYNNDLKPAEATPGQAFLVYEGTTGRLLYDPDGVGGNAGITLAVLNDKPGLTVNDITLI